MRENNLLAILDKLIRSSYFHCEWGIEWEEQQNYIELIFQFNLPNENLLPLMDNLSNYVRAKDTPYEFRVIIYDSHLLEIEGNQHIVSIPVDATIGIPYGEIVCIVKYLKALTSSVRSKWADFMHNPKQQVFSIEWEEDKYQQIKQSILESNRYNHTAIYFPRQSTEE